VGGKYVEIFKIAEDYINTPKSMIIQKCCRLHGNACRLHRTKSGDSLAHLAAYEGNTELLEKLMEEGFPKDQWQLVEGGLFLYRTQLMYAAEQGHGATVQSLVKEIKVNPNTVNEEEKKAIDLARAKGKMNVVGILEPFLSDIGGVQDALRTGRRANIINAFANSDNMDENIRRVSTLQIFKDIEKLFRTMNSELSLT
jgi:ankyrin repeat protein